MIDIEHQVFDRVAKAIRASFPKAVVRGEYVRSPSSFPFVSLVEQSNTTYRDSQTTTNFENHVSLLYVAEIYSNKKTAKKDECRRIAAILDQEMRRIGFDRSFLQPTPNMEDSTIYRIVGRYRAIVGQDHKIYRR